MALIKALIFGIVGFLIGAGITMPFGASSNVVISVGYLLGLVGWLLGVGVWDHWARGWLGLENKPLPTQASHGARRYFAFCGDHKVIGVQYLVTMLVLFLLAGLMSVLIRIELMNPGQDLMGPGTYNTVMSWHGIVMIAVAVAALLGGFGNFAVPLLIGAEDMAFPRLNALSYWLVPPVGVLMVLALFMPGGFDFGWTAYPPLSVQPGVGKMLFLLAFITFGLSSIIGGLNFLTTIATMRAPGMTWGRLPIFVWGAFCGSILSLIFTQFVAAALIMVVLDRVIGTAFFGPTQGGGALLYEHIFWIYSHPAVYVMIIPGFALMLEALPHFARKPLFGYKWAVGGMLGIVGLSGIVWAHHMFTSGMSDWLNAPFLIATELISIPTGLIFLAAVGTIWMGRLRLTVPMLFALGELFNFTIGGLTGIFLADAPTDFHLHDSYFVVAHFHYTIMGGEIFALFIGIYYWFPKITGRMYNEALGKLHFWWMFLAFNVTFLSMFMMGYNGMNRRIADYSSELAANNMFTSLVAFILAASFLVFVYNIVVSWIRGPKAATNPWQLRTLEWSVPSPAPEHNFPEVPQVTGHPYDYGVPDSVHAVVGAPAIAAAGGGGD
ncbi:MAG: cbb3-type cytochrome c oxidase subunit I [Anaerolineae bacterium]